MPVIDKALLHPRIERYAELLQGISADCSKMCPPAAVLVLQSLITNSIQS